MLFTFVSLCPSGLKGGSIANMSHLYTSSPQKTTHHVVAIGVFFKFILTTVSVLLHVRIFLQLFAFFGFVSQCISFESFRYFFSFVSSLTGFGGMISQLYLHFL